jgi:TatD DNase family protein
MFSESHCHLGEISDEAIRKAESDGFTLLMTSGIDLNSSMKSVETAKKYKIVKACIGVHPWYADDYNDKIEEKFMKLAKLGEVVAISEIGLDFKGRMTKEWVREDRYIEKSIQYNAFKSQLKLARSLDMPAIIHDRADGQEILNIIEEYGDLESGIAIHGFSKGPEYAERCVNLGIMLSVGIRTVETGEPEFIEAIKRTPLDYLLTETDSSNPEGVLRLCDLIGEIKGLTRQQVGTAATRNLMRLCNL